LNAAELTYVAAALISLVTFLHVVVGELDPKTLAIQKAEAITLMFARPIIIFYQKISLLKLITIIKIIN
jgi:CBS domain containing-hemolysin-like protein